MPVGGGKPAGGYHVGEKGSYGCNGYPAVSADGTVHGCHPTRAAAQQQVAAIWASTSKANWAGSPFDPETPTVDKGDWK